MKISKRLQRIDQVIKRHYPEIWDCCCDHGLLGMILLQRQAADKIHFVDIEEPLITELHHKLSKFFPSSPKHPAGSWQLHMLDARNIKLSDNTVQLIVISGVGGELTAKLVGSILQNHPNHQLEFLLCPVHHHYPLRQALQQMNLGLASEHLIKENHRFYEIIHVSTTAHAAIVATGSQMWNFSRSDNRDYLCKTIAHYRRKLDGLQKKTASTKAEQQIVEKTIADYNRLLPEQQSKRPKR